MVVSFLEDFKGLPLSPGAHLEHSSPSKEVSQQLQKILVEQSPSVPETAPNWALVVSRASELQGKRVHYHLVSDSLPFLLHPPFPTSTSKGQGHF